MSLDPQPYLDAIESHLQRLLTPPENASSDMYGMMRYHMGWADEALRPLEAPRGKRLRPLLCLLACEAAGGDWRSAVPAACAIELVHNFSLLHDDIEDNSTTRRHRPTAWTLWGVPQALNTGDAMWAVSHLANHELTALGHPPERVLAAIRRLDEACLRLCSGQYLDLRFEQMDVVSVAEYEEMISGKTAALLSAAVAIGALLGGAEEGVVEEWAAYGHLLGISFQVVDDILGIWGDAGETVKSAASDIVTRKKTLPVLYALDWEREQGLSDLADLYARPTIEKADVAQALALLERAGARKYAQRWADDRQEQGLAHLRDAGGQPDVTAALAVLTLTLLYRLS